MDKIKILNPAHPGGSITSRKRADRYVRRGVAKWAGAESIQFVESDYRFVSAKLALIDGGMSTVKQVQGLPCAGPAINAFVIRSKRGNGYRVAY